MCVIVLVEIISIRLGSRGIYCIIYLEITCVHLNYHKTKTDFIVVHLALHRQDSNREL